MDFVNLLLMCLVGALGGWLMMKLRVPGGMFAGSLIASAILSIAMQPGPLPSGVKTFAQIIAGAYVACGIDLEELKDVRRLIKPAIILISGLFICNVIAGLVIWKISDVDLLTALMCATPGGCTTIPLIAAELGAEISSVTVVQISRSAICVSFFPTLIMKVNGEHMLSDLETPGKGRARKNIVGDVNFRALAITLAVAAVSGLTGKKLGVPAGTILFSIVAVLILKKNTKYAYMPLWMRRTAQCLSGACIGSSITLENILALHQMAVPLIVLLIIFFGNSFFTGYIFHRFLGFEMAAGMLAATPAGSSDMALISEEMGHKSVIVTELHILRLLIVNIVFPQILVVIAGLIE